MVSLVDIMEFTNGIIKMIKKLLKYKNDKDVRYFLKQGKYKLLLQIVTLGSTFFISWFLANYTSKEFFGNYQFILATLGILTIFSFPGIKDAIIQSVARGCDYSLVQGTKKAMKFSLLGSLTLILIGGYYYFLKGDSIISIVFLIASIFFPFFYTLDNFIYFLNGKKRFKIEFFYTSIITIFKALIIFLVVLLFKENLIFLFVGFFLSQLLLYLYFFLRCNKDIKSKEQDKGLINYGWFITKISFLALVANQIDKLLIGIFVGPKILAIYIIGIALPDKLNNLLRPLLSIFLPRFATGKTRLTKKKILLVFFISFFLFIVLLFILPLFIQILFKDYTNSIKYGLLYSIIILFSPLNALLSYYFRGQKNTKAIRSHIVISRISTIILAIPLLKIFGIVGLISVKILENIISLIILLVYLRKSSSKIIKKYNQA